MTHSSASRPSRGVVGLSVVRNGQPQSSRVISPRSVRAGEVFQLIRSGRADTTSELAATMGLARSTVTERLEGLQRLGLVIPAGETAPVRGRPAGRLAFNAKAGVTLAAHVGMSGTMIAITDLAADVEWRTQIQFDVANGPDALFEILQREFNNGLVELQRSLDDVFGIAIGLPGDIEITSAPGRSGGTAHAWGDNGLAARVSAAFRAPAVVDRDVNLMAIGEHRSAWPDAEVFMCLKVGTVIACGLTIGNHVVQGATGLVGEIGHTKLPGAQAPCACGSRGCLNTVAGGPALAARLREQGVDAHDARDVAALANSGSIEAGQAVRLAGESIGEVVAGAVNLLNPDVITLWGYLVDAGDQFIAGLQEAVYKAALPSAARAVRIVRSTLGDDAGLRGAALTVLDQALSPERIDEMVDLGTTRQHAIR